MKYIAFPEANTLFAAPKGMEETCGSLPAMVTTDDQGYDCVVSAWMPSPEDIESMQAGHPVYLKVVGGQPPVSLFTLSESGELNP
jgi:hypothetical protein